MLEEYVWFGSKNEIGRKMTKAIDSELLDGFCLQSELSKAVGQSSFKFLSQSYGQSYHVADTVHVVAQRLDDLLNKQTY